MWLFSFSFFSAAGHFGFNFIHQNVEFLFLLTDDDIPLSYKFDDFSHHLSYTRVL